MKIIIPIDVTPTNLTSSNVPETDAPLWTPGTYVTGTQRIYDHRLYVVVAVPDTSDQPDVGAVAVPPTWQDLGATNRYKMFDEIVGSQTVQNGMISVTITPGAIVNAVGLFNSVGTTARVRVTDPVDGVVYDETKNLQDNDAVVNWYEYFFSPILQRTDVVFLDLPNYGSAAITVDVDAGVSDAKVGECVLGFQQALGTSNYGTGVGIDDYSRKERDGFGNFIITERAFNKRGDFDVTVVTTSISFVQKTLAAVRAKPIVYIGDENREETIIYGFFKSFSIVLGSPSISQCNLQVEGLT